ncbi:hypothetical protein EYF80_016954 [Liparis tanakae]|uniref:Uncharacterized protein n=1 Tax=Liparis tanakae TaxID=230148 RepID=A0A4Z2I6J1_9TELE|nr:hypothetical protein EYF80_016954 [Liparis tanakae]
MSAVVLEEHRRVFSGLGRVHECCRRPVQPARFLNQNGDSLKAREDEGKTVDKCNDKLEDTTRRPEGYVADQWWRTGGKLLLLLPPPRLQHTGVSPPPSPCGGAQSAGRAAS